MAPFLVSFSFSLAPSLLIFSYVTHGSPPVCFSFYILFSFNFFPLFLFFCIFSFPSLLSFFGAPFLSLFFSPFPCFFLFRPSFLAPLLDPPGCKRTLCTPQDTPLLCLTPFCQKLNILCSSDNFSSLWYKHLKLAFTMVVFERIFFNIIYVRRIIRDHLIHAADRMDVKHMPLPEVAVWALVKSYLC